MTTPHAQPLARHLGVRPRQVEAAVRLLDDGATVPFVARYRKEATGGLDDLQLRGLAAELGRLRDLDARRQTILDALKAQGDWTDALARQLAEADTRARLEDLYRPFKKRRKTKADTAREAGLEALADRLVRAPDAPPERVAQRFVGRGVASVDEALDGARAIWVQRLGDDPDLVEAGRRQLREHGRVVSRVVGCKAKTPEAQRFRDWFDHAERFDRMPSHRALAVLRGADEGVLRVKVALDDRGTDIALRRVAHGMRVRDRGRPGDAWLVQTVRTAWSRLAQRLGRQLLTELKDRAGAEAIEVFAANTRDLLLAPPAGRKVTLGLDPGIRTGVKVAVVDATGKVLDTTAVYPFPPKRDVEGTLRTLEGLCRRHGVQLVALGNGTGSRETDRLVKKLLGRLPEPRPEAVIVSEAGASIYSASERASEELGHLDVSLRGAVSIARRTQDPLAELVKIDPAALGVGQYQHDVSQTDLRAALDGVVEDCVNAVGVDLNTASPDLLARVAGLSTTLAERIVARRDARGPYRRREELLEVSRLGPKTYEQCAGFLRIPHGDDPVDATGVHPEARSVVKRLARSVGRSVPDLVGDASLLEGLRPEDHTDDRFGVPTVRDILAELARPGRDPRGDFRTAALAEGIETLDDLQEGMELEGTVTNVTHFGAFVDLGVHQDGLVHISELADRFVKDPREVVRVGQVVTVRVLGVDRARKRISLSRKQVGQAR